MYHVFNAEWTGREEESGLNKLGLFVKGAYDQEKCSPYFFYLNAIMDELVSHVGRNTHKVISQLHHNKANLVRVSIPAAFQASKRSVMSRLSTINDH